MSVNGTLGIEMILKLYGPFFIKPTEPRREDSLLLTDRFPGVSLSFDRLLKD